MKHTFDQLPASIQERLLWDMELDYDSYESSNADTIHSILVGSTFSERNQQIVRNYCKALSDETIKVYARQEREAIAASLAALDKFIQDT